MRKITFLLVSLGVASLTAVAFATGYEPLIQVRGVEVRADAIEMVSPTEFWAKGNVLISTSLGETRALRARVLDKREIVTIEAFGLIELVAQQEEQSI